MSDCSYPNNDLVKNMSIKRQEIVHLRFLQHWLFQVDNRTGERVRGHSTLTVGTLNQASQSLVGTNYTHPDDPECYRGDNPKPTADQEVM
jgi:hypothetical protein